MAGKHALCAPSAAEQWMNCPGSVAMQANEPEQSSEFAEEGTRAHEFAAAWISVGSRPGLLQDDEMAEHLKFYVDYVKQRVTSWLNAGAVRVERLVEKRLPLSDVTGERGAEGTADVILIVEFADYAILDVIDLKYGRGVEVEAVDNKQLRIYTLAALRLYGLLQDFREANLVIVQPRLSRTPKEWKQTVAELDAFGAQVYDEAQLALRIMEDGATAALGHLRPGEEQCRFCRAKHKCPALAQQVHETVFGEMQAIDAPDAAPVDDTVFEGSREDYAHLLPLFMKRVPLIEDWCAAIRGKVETELLAGRGVEGYKLVQGRMGARKWTDEDAVVTLVLGQGLSKEAIYTLPTVRSPADAEKQLKGHPSVWQPLQGLITQAPGKPSVALADDPRPTWSAPVFDGESYDADDLF